MHSYLTPSRSSTQQTRLAADCMPDAPPPVISAATRAYVAELQNKYHPCALPVRFPTCAKQSSQLLTTRARYPKIPHLTIEWGVGKELGKGAFGIVYLANNMQDGSNAALKRITLSITKDEPIRAFTDALSEVSSLQMLLNKRVVAYKGFYVETDNFEATGIVHFCILLE